jgi:predicted CoA-binding protein
MSKPTVAILGASANRSKFGNKSVRAHLRQGYEVYPVNPREATIEGLKVYPSLDDVPEPLDRVSVYLPPDVGMSVLEAIAKKRPKELWLNPGAESDALIQKAKSLGLHVIVACSIVDLGTSPHEFDDR